MTQVVAGEIAVMVEEVVAVVRQQQVQFQSPWLVADKLIHVRIDQNHPQGIGLDYNEELWLRRVAKGTREIEDVTQRQPDAGTSRHYARLASPGCLSRRWAFNSPLWSTSAAMTDSGIATDLKSLRLSEDQVFFQAPSWAMSRTAQCPTRR